MIRTYDLNQGSPACTEYRQGAPLPEEGWINLVNPSPEECSLVHERLDIPLEHLRAALDHNERPRLEYASGILLIIARTPLVKEGEKRINAFSTSPIALIFRGGLLVTVCLTDMAEVILGRKLQGGNAYPAERLMLNFLMRISTTFIQELQLMDDNVSDIERSLHQSMQNRELIRMLHIEKALIYFLTALKGNQAVLEKLKSSAYSISCEENRSLLDDVLIENKQATDMAEIYTQIIGSLGDTFGAIVSNNLNKVMKVLTSLTIVFMVPSIIGSLYGMNVDLPMQEKPYAFVALCFLCLGISFALFYVLKKKDWM